MSDDAELIDPTNPQPKPDPDQAEPRWRTDATLESLMALAKTRPLNARESALLSGLVDLRSEDSATRARGRQTVLAAESQNLQDDHLGAKLGGARGSAGDTPGAIFYLPHNGRGPMPAKSPDGKLVIYDPKVQSDAG